ncbi:MAG: metalloregulator ArsR/SmtB family transcription factor [Herbinix sp.]|nr:metalloregulator ArsR/SmtB family transcription factor [Herbinix sp.]
MNDNYNQNALALKALSDPNRLVIIDFLNSGERCACKILEQLKISQPTLSHHMRILCEVHLVNWHKEGKWIHYSLNREKFNELKELLGSFSIGEEDNNTGNCC